MPAPNKKKNIIANFVDHRVYVDTYRKNVVRVLRNIQKGSVVEDDLNKLLNFCQMSLALLEVVNIDHIRQAWTNAELMSFMHPEAEDLEVVLDPKLQLRTVDDEFTRVGALSSGYERKVGTLASEMLGLKIRDTMAGNAHNLPELQRMIDHVKTLNIKSVIQDHVVEGEKTKLTLFALGVDYPRRLVAISDDRFGIFCSRDTAQYILDTYKE